MPPMRSAAAPSRATGLYIHVPFCERKCAYCAFYSQRAEPDAVTAWHRGIARELASLPDGFSPDSIFFGGGTPTALTDARLETLLDSIRAQVNLSRVREWTCEVNPGTLSSCKASLLRDAGVNRLSIGAQSFCDETLGRLGRIHTAAETAECVALARETGFQNVGLDLIYGIPGVSQALFEADVEALIELNPEHISCYCLEIEEGTPFAERVKEGSLTVSESAQCHQFDWARCRLSKAGWGHYEISNFAKAGFECRQNLLYWNGGAYIGLGPAAHSHWEGIRWGNTSELPEWKRAFEERLDPKAKACETLVMGLRRLAGWGRDEFREATGFAYVEVRGAEIERLTAAGLLLKEGDRIRLADDALFVSDTVFSDLV